MSQSEQWVFADDRNASTSEDDVYCGRNCPCCYFDDGTVPEDHSPKCMIFTGWHDCSCGYSEAVFVVGCFLLAILGVTMRDGQIEP